VYGDHPPAGLAQQARGAVERLPLLGSQVVGEMQPRHRVDEQGDGDGRSTPELGQRLRLLRVDRAEHGDEQTVGPTVPQRGADSV
jgi:hypothetical protein